MVREALCLSIQKVAMPLKSIRNAIRPNTRGWVEIFVLNASQADSDSFVVRRFRGGEGVSGGERAGGRASGDLVPWRARSAYSAPHCGR